MAIPNRILFVLTSHKALGDTGKDTGFYLSEVSHPYYVLKDAGFQIDFASIQAGKTPMDGVDRSDEDNARFLDDAELLKALETAPALADVDPSFFDAVYFPGGHGTMWDFPGNEDIERVARDVWERGGVVSAVCHGPAALTEIRLSDGKLLVNGRKVAAFTNAEEKAMELEDVVPFLLESRLEERGATVETAGNFETQVVVDGQLITGQNPPSAKALAKAIVKALKAATVS